MRTKETHCPTKQTFMQIDLELNIYYLSIAEALRSEEEYTDYQGAVVKMLELKNMPIPESEILQRHQKKNMQEVFEQVENGFLIYAKAEQKDESGNVTFVWYDTWADYFISENDPLYSVFFTYKIRHIDLTDIDDFLNYQLTEKYDGNFPRFTRFLTIAMRKHATALLTNAHIKTANEWLLLKQEEINQNSSETETVVNIKGRPKRTGDDKLTVLNQEQTVLLIHYLQKAKVFYQGDFLTNKQAGQAFHILTGYSADTIRLKLGSNELDLINSKKNLTDLHNLFIKISNLISNELKDKK